MKRCSVGWLGIGCIAADSNRTLDVNTFFTVSMSGEKPPKIVVLMMKGSRLLTSCDLAIASVASILVGDG
jgi:hypothetical protein